MSIESNKLMNLADGKLLYDDLRERVEDRIEAPSTPGSSGQVLTSDGQGGQSWQPPTGGDPTEIIDDTAGVGDTDKVWSAQKSSTENSALMSAIELRSEVKDSTATGIDLDIADENGNVLVRFKDGEIETGNFGSKDTASIKNQTTFDAEMSVADENGNVEMIISGGQIRTKGFSSDNGVYEKLFTYNKTAGTAKIIHFFPAGTRLAFHLTDISKHATDGIGSTEVTYKYTDRNGSDHSLGADYGYNFPEYTLPEDATAVSVSYGNSGLIWTDSETFSFKVYSVASFDRKPTIITVGQSGKDYTSLRSALDYASERADAMNRYEVHVYPGTYDTLEDYTSEEIDAEGFQGLFVTNGVSLIGIGQSGEVILTATMSTSDYTTQKRNDVSTLNVCGNVTVKNVTIKAENIRYALHDDTALGGHQEDTHYYEEVIFYGENLTSSGDGERSYGAGGGSLKKLYFKNCDFSDAMVIHTSANMTHEYSVFIENCRSRMMGFSDYNSVKQAHFYLKNCDVSLVQLNMSGSHDQFLQLEGEGTNGAMVSCPSGYVYALDGVRKYFGSNVTAGKAVKLNSTMTAVSVADSLDSVFGVSIGVANGATYVQTDGWVNSNSLGLSGLSVGDYLTVNINTGAVEVGSASNAIAQVRHIDNNGIAFAKLSL